MRHTKRKQATERRHSHSAKTRSQSIGALETHLMNPSVSFLKTDPDNIAGSECLALDTDAIGNLRWQLERIWHRPGLVAFADFDFDQRQLIAEISH